MSQLKDLWAEKRQMRWRTIISATIMLGLTGLVIARLVQLQVTEYDIYSAQSEGNHIRVQPIAPPRGLIFDRNGNVLAENLPSYSLQLTREQVPDLDDTLERLVLHGLLAADEIEEARELISSHRSFDAVTLRQRLTDEEVAAFAVERPRFAGVEVRANLVRNYPYGQVASHALGYVGAISADDKARLDPAEYAGTSQIGKISVERSFEDRLHGNVGHAEVLVNARGRVMEPLRTTPATPGDDLILSLDMNTQLAAEQALAGYRGAAVAIDPRNGEILAFASLPGYDPNDFATGISVKNYNALREDLDLPLFNRALRGQYPPGSTVKPIIALAGMREGITDPSKRWYCYGHYSLPGQTHRYRDWKPQGHGMVDLTDAMAQSCDTYFYSMAAEMGIDPIEKVLRDFGLGEPTNVDVLGEKGGLVPSREWKRTAFRKKDDQVWFPGETVITGIGQGYLLTTPLQLAHATATVAARGERYQPTFLHGRHDVEEDRRFRRKHQQLDERPAATDAQWDSIIDSMRAVIEDPLGTARAIGDGAEYTIAGKSGTAQVFTVAQDEQYNEEEVEERMRDHALFVAFAPIEAPRIAVAVVVENGGSGSGVAAPVARKVMDAWLKGNGAGS